MNHKDLKIPTEAIHCISGLIYKVLEEGLSKNHPGPEDIVWAIMVPGDTEVKGQLDDYEIQTFSLKETGAGLSEAFQLMGIGHKLRVWIPRKLQDNISEKDKSKFMVYDLKLIDFERTKPPPSIPDHLISPGLE